MTDKQQDLCYLSIPQAGRLIASRQLSPVELTRAFLERIQAVDQRVKAYVTLMADSALAEARTAEGEVLHGRYRGPLHGIPIALKDLYDTRGVRTTAQSRVLERRVPSEDATVVRKLRDAGGVILGKVAMHEFALGGPATSLFEQARNPWNLDHVTGGSSSGSAAAVAAGLCMGSLGSDTGGSIRGPASLCGIVGLKPTYGRVSRQGVIPLSWSLDHCGPMTWTVEDAAILLGVIAGADPSDPTASNAPVPDYTQALREDVKGLTIGVPRHYFFNPEVVDAQVLGVVEAALTEMERLGARVQEVTIPSLEHASAANTVMMIGQGYTYHRKDLINQPQSFGETVRLRLSMGALFTTADYVQAQRLRSRIRREFAQALQGVDLIACPTSLNTAATFADVDPLIAVRTPSFTAPFNQTGMPAISVPCGFNSDGLPVGLQLAGRPFDEPTMLRVAYTYQQSSRWYEKRPGV
ncbi:MAG: Asp-tRNA(Asn)/Glu-tRNA(Gln) amidotransferase subunit GatA [Chloroflexi bacterium]|nr:Asp-tRNA(Asn)/Glu-tRNA(Gln) amidotransferase subunit GatA [Chloroflexota bacterium]